MAEPKTEPAKDESKPAVEPTPAAAPEAKAAPEPKAAKEPKAPKAAKTEAEEPVERFVVTVDALVISMGKDKVSGQPETTRLLHGAFIDGKASDPRIASFLATKTIKRHTEGARVPRATATMVTQAHGSEADPALAPRADVQPSNAIGSGN